MGLLLLLSDWCRKRNLNLLVVTVNHQLRGAAEQECKFVKTVANDLGWDHETLYWKNPTPGGNLPHKAREGRYRIMAEWACALGIEEIILGHTQNDQAETVLMELKRKAGVEGLSAMPQSLARFGVRWVRPLLDISRAEIRGYLSSKNQVWIEDPSNEDNRLTRIQIRNLLPQLEEVGISISGLAKVAANLQKTRHVLECVIRTRASEVISVSKAGEYVMSTDYWELPEEIRVKLFARVVQFLAGHDYKPRQSAVNNCLKRVEAVGSSTISNLVIRRDSNNCVRVFRDLKKSGDFVPVSKLWDDRWRVSDTPALARKLGNLGPRGLEQLEKSKDREYECGGTLASPALWSEDDLLVETIFHDFGTSTVFEDTKNREAFLLFLDNN